jgi:hypothetical protein
LDVLLALLQPTGALIVRVQVENTLWEPRGGSHAESGHVVQEPPVVQIGGALVVQTVLFIDERIIQVELVVLHEEISSGGPFHDVQFPLEIVQLVTDVFVLQVDGQQRGRLVQGPDQSVPQG